MTAGVETASVTAGVVSVVTASVTAGVMSKNNFAIAEES